MCLRGDLESVSSMGSLLCFGFGPILLGASRNLGTSQGRTWFVEHCRSPASSTLYRGGLREHHSAPCLQGSVPAAALPCMAVKPQGRN